jgi:NAD(P)-dependent dehydrogenase (short-subunit alcohol dehydrogenase family)
VTRLAGNRSGLAVDPRAPGRFRSVPAPAAGIAVANAGIVPNCPVLDMSVEEWDRVMETNMRGVFLTCHRRGARGRSGGGEGGMERGVPV